MAKEYLLFTEESISEISQSCGFDDRNYFSRIFVKTNKIKEGKTITLNEYLKRKYGCKLYKLALSEALKTHKKSMILAVPA